tara:strand:- start:1047 stop:1469 length:423 start_codon:yes stop_codon:yes gene_type:complete
MSFQNLNNKVLRGYISSRDINGAYYPQNIQNLIIRNFASQNNIKLQLSGTEWIIEKSFLMLRSLLREKNDGIIFFSIFQVYENSNKFNKIINQILSKKKFLAFALENIQIQNKKELIDLENKLKLNKIINSKSFFKKYAK